MQDQDVNNAARAMVQQGMAVSMAEARRKVRLIDDQQRQRLADARREAKNKTESTGVTHVVWQMADSRLIVQPIVDAAPANNAKLLPSE